MFIINQVMDNIWFNPAVSIYDRANALESLAQLDVIGVVTPDRSTLDEIANSLAQPALYTGIIMTNIVQITRGIEMLLRHDHPSALQLARSVVNGNPNEPFVQKRLLPAILAAEPTYLDDSYLTDLEPSGD